MSAAGTAASRAISAPRSVLPFCTAGSTPAHPSWRSRETELAGLSDIRLLRADLVLEPADRALPDETFAFVGVFGLLHHVPGESRRRDLLRALTQRVAPGGFLALAFWDFAREPRFERKILASPPAEIRDDLEPGDVLLRWGAEGSSELRYCHHTDEAEELRLLADLPLVSRLAFSSDGAHGRSNRYRVLERL